MLCLRRCSFCALGCMWGAFGELEVKNIAYKRKHAAGIGGKFVPYWYEYIL